MGKALAISGNSASGLGGSPLTITVPGILAIRSNAGQLPAFYNSTVNLQGATLAVTQAGIGSQVVDVALATSPATILFTLTLPSGQFSVSATAAQIAACPPIPANVNVVLAITAVGTTPAQELTLNLF